MFSDPKTLAIAFIGGILPSLLWLWFWIKEEENKPEPMGVLTVVFMMGMIAVLAVLPIQKLIQVYIHNPNIRLVGWAGIEEIMKYLAAIIILYKTNEIDEPIDWPIYMITVALGFAALENALFLLKPLASGATVVGLLTGQLRFLGSTLLHTVSSAILGVALGVSLHLSGFKKMWHGILGLCFAIALHSVFNFFIIRNDGTDFLKVFGFLWVVTIVVMLLFEKLRRMV